MFNAVKNVAVVLLIVKVIGLVKQSVVAYYYGATEATDIYLLVSQLVENLGFVLFSSVAIAFLTMYTKEKEEKETSIAKSQIFSNTLFYGLPITIILGILVFFLSEQIAYILAPGYTGEAANTVSEYIKILSSGMVLMFTATVFRTVLNAEKHFIPPKLEGIIKSALAIGACVIWGVSGNIVTLVYSILGYFIISNIYLLAWVLLKTDVRIKFPKKDNRLKTLIILSVPLFISNGSVYLNNVVSKAIGSTLDAGSISILSYSGIITSSAHSLMIGSLTTVLLTYFSGYIVNNEMNLLKSKLISSLRIIVLSMSFVAIIICSCSEEIIELFYGRGAFSSDDVNTTAIVLIINGIGLIFIGIRDVLIYTHYAFEANKIAMINGVIGIFINIGLSLLLAEHLGVYGLAIATTVGYLATMIISIVTINKYIKIDFFKNIKKLLLTIGIAAFIIMTLSMAINYYEIINNWFIGLLVKGAGSTLIFIIILYTSKNAELETAIKKLKNRRRTQNEDKL